MPSGLPTGKKKHGVLFWFPEKVAMDQKGGVLFCFLIEFPEKTQTPQKSWKERGGIHWASGSLFDGQPAIALSGLHFRRSRPLGAFIVRHSMAPRAGKMGGLGMRACILERPGAKAVEKPRRWMASQASGIYVLRLTKPKKDTSGRAFHVEKRPVCFCDAKVRFPSPLGFSWNR